MQRFELYLTKPQVAALDREAKRTGLSRAELIRRAIDRYLKESV